MGEIELERARPLFSGVTPQRLAALFEKWGGTIRWTLANAKLSNNLGELQAAIAESDMRAIYSAAGGRSAKPLVSC